MTRTTLGPWFLAAGLALPAMGLAQPLGTFRWQLEHRRTPPSATSAGAAHARPGRRP
jgi:hypothetical protein